MTERDTGSNSPPTAGPDSIQVVETIADYVGKDPIDVDFTLDDYIDPEALDTLLESSTEELVVAFTIDDLLITVANDGTIEVKEY